MDEFNPYAPPKANILADLDSLNEEGVWRDGLLLVMTKGATLPPRCLKCNRDTGGWTLKRKLMWHPPYWYGLIALNLIIYVIVAMIVRHTATVMVPLCEHHRSRRRRLIAIGWGLILSAVAAFLVALQYPKAEGLAGVALLILFVVGIFTIGIGTRTAIPKRIDKRFVRLQKVHPDFLAELHPWAF